MKIATQLLLNFLLNAIWQIAAIALAAAAGGYLLRSVTRFRHVLWVFALMMSLALPIGSAIFSLKRETAPTVGQQRNLAGPVLAMPDNIVPASRLTNAPSDSGGVHVSGRIALSIVLAFFVLFAYRGARLFRAWMKTRAIRRSAIPIELNGELNAIAEECRDAFRIRNFSICGSSRIKTPATVGILNPIVILPEQLLTEGDRNALMAAIGHELAHVSRRDYLLNLIYELILLPLSFHPAAAFMKRQITKTRELRCDELVAERLLHHEVYARSLVRLAGWALPLNRRAQTIIVGIADADILEVRIMSLLKRSKSSFRRNLVLLIAAALLLTIPGVAAAAFAISFNIEPTLQGPSREEQERREMRSRREQEIKEKMQRQAQELTERIKAETNAEVREKLERELGQLKERMARPVAMTSEGEGYMMLRDEGRAREEREQEAKERAALAQLAKISMDQAIQIATSQSPGKVLECSLVGERRQMGEPARPSQVFYHVVILSGDEANPVTMHVLVNAVDGSVVQIDKEGRKRENPESLDERRREPLKGGLLNGKAISLPQPEYPEIAKQVKASGNVTVEITVDETGHVIEARAVSGHPLLQAAAVTAARQAVFAPTRLEGEPVKVGGAIVYNFVAQ